MVEKIMKICLVRHGETDWNKLHKYQGRENIPLNETGKNQIKETAKYLKKFSWDEMVTSPLLRAKQSAEIIAKEIKNKKIHEDEGFIEIDVGEISGMTPEEKAAAFPDGKINGMESFECLQKRVVGSLNECSRIYFGKNIIIVSHGAAINSVLAYLSDNEIGTGKTILKNACVNLLEYDGRDYKIIFYNKEPMELNSQGLA
jgi:uncharacterized phosphatase